MSEEIEMNVKTDKQSLKAMKRRNNGLTNKKRLLIKTIFIPLCVLPFVYLSSKLIYQYLKKETVVVTTLDIDKFSPLPAITVCYPYLLSMERVVQKYPHLKPKFDEYIKSFDNMTELGNKTLAEYQDNLYHEHFVKFIDKQNLTINQMSELGISYTISREREYSVGVEGMRLYKNNTIKKWESYEFKLIESIGFDRRDPFHVYTIDHKCFTFLSHLDKEMSKIQMNKKRISIIAGYNRTWFPNDDFELSVLLHSPRDLPKDYDGIDWLNLKLGYRYDIKYNQIETVLQPLPYKTKCKDYDNNEHDHIRTHSDCLNQCLNQELNQKCSHSLKDSGVNGVDNRTHCLLSFDRNLWRQQLFEQGQYLSDMKLCNYSTFWNENNTIGIKDDCITRLKESVHVQCEQSCGTDCKIWFYEYQVKGSVETNPEYVWFIITHNHIPDQTIEHLPKMTFEEITGTVGGLMGMWLGLSALALFKHMLKLI